MSNCRPIASDTFTAHNVMITNPNWAHANDFATLDAISFDVEAPPQIAHRMVTPAIDLVNPSVDLERLKDGHANWVFGLKYQAMLIQVLYSIRSERQLMEQVQYNLLFRWFIGLAMDDEVWVPTVFTKNC